jgi:hypothetical protein
MFHMHRLKLADTLSEKILQLAFVEVIELSANHIVLIVIQADLQRSCVL